MDLYEYQARELLEEQHIPTPRAVFAQNSHEVAEAADAIGYPCVIKAQVKIGHRGQAGGVKIAHNRDEAILLSESILPMTIHGHKVNGVLVAEAKNILHEYYVSISVDRTSRDFDVLATANGGTEVEEIAKEHPESVKRLHINALGDFDMEAAKRMAGQIGFYHADLDQAANILLRMWQCFKDNDATLVEINPLAKIGDPDDEASKSLCALDAKISLDGNAAFRHDGWARFDDPMQADPFEAAAAEHGLHYVHLDGQVGVIGNGAGLVMSSLDAVWDAGKEQGTNVTPANFLDIGGGASAAVMSDSLSIVLSDPQVESVFINVYGGITSCEQVAKGILQAFEELHTSKPLVVRFDGNAAAEGLQILAAANNPNLHVEGTMEQAAAEAARLAAEGYREIVVTGIEISSWGQDLKDGETLIDLLEAVCAAAPDVRIRLGSLEPRTITEAFCRRAAALENLCPQFHLSMQSGCDATLKRMNRKYDTARYAQSVELLNQYFEHPAVTTDLITGFPEETEEEFQQTLAFLLRCGFAQMHIFPYSIRPGTPAAQMRQVPKAVKEERAHRAAEAAAELHRKYLADCVGAVYPVLFEQPRDGRYVGHAPNYMEVLAEGADLHNQIRNVKITGSDGESLLGEILED